MPSWAQLYRVSLKKRHVSLTAYNLFRQRFHISPFHELKFNMFYTRVQNFIEIH